MVHWTVPGEMSCVVPDAAANEHVSESGEAVYS